MLLALELIVERRGIWRPVRLKRVQLAGAFGRRFTTALLRRIRWFERFSRPPARAAAAPAREQACSSGWSCSPSR
jgi:hypothetical protein